MTGSRGRPASARPATTRQAPARPGSAMPTVRQGAAMPSVRQRGFYSEVLDAELDDATLDQLYTSASSGPRVRSMQPRLVAPRQMLPRASQFVKAGTLKAAAERRARDELAARASAPSRALEPKVLVPFQPTPGAAPRRIVIERQKRLFALQDLTQLLSDQEIDSSVPGERRRAALLPRLAGPRWDGGLGGHVHPHGLSHLRAHSAHAQPARPDRPTPPFLARCLHSLRAVPRRWQTRPARCLSNCSTTPSTSAAPSPSGWPWPRSTPTARATCPPSSSARPSRQAFPRSGPSATFRTTTRRLRASPSTTRVPSALRA